MIGSLKGGVQLFIIKRTYFLLNPKFVCTFEKQTVGFSLFMHLRHSTLVVSQLFIESVPWDILGQYDDKIRILFASLLSSFIEKRFPRELMGQDV